MLRKIGFGLLCAGALFSAGAVAMTHSLPQGVSIEYQLPPNDPQMFANTFFWKITATCTIHSDSDESSEILAEGMNKQGSINGIPLAKGDSRVLEVHPNDTLVLSADSGAKVNLTNLSQHLIVASCSTS